MKLSPTEARQVAAGWSATKVGKIERLPGGETIKVLAVTYNDKTKAIVTEYEVLKD